MPSAESLRLNKETPGALHLNRSLLVAQRFGGADACGGRGRIERSEKRDADRDDGDDNAIEDARSERKCVERVDVGRELDVVVATGPRTDVAEDQAEDRANDCDQKSLQQEDAAHLAGIDAEAHEDS